MNGHRAVIGLALLGALSLCAFAAQSASAAFVPAVNTTAFTCVPGGGNKDFKDAHCDEKVAPETGSFGHVLIPAGETKISVTNAKTAKGTEAAEPSVLKMVLGGVNSEITATTVTGEGVILNEELPAGSKNHQVTGTVTTKFTGITVNKPLNCTAKEIVVKSFFKGVEKGGPKENTMGLEFTPDPEKAPFAEIPLEGEKCALKGKTFVITGTMIATGTPKPEEKHSGATTFFTNEMTKETLKVGEGAAELSSKTTISMTGGGNPISLTTVT